MKTSAGRRTLPLLTKLRDVLVLHAASHSIHLDVDADPATTAYADRLVITSKTGAPVEPGNFARTFQLITEQAGLPRITVHHTRHTAATMLKKLGVSARDAQLILGHSNVTTTQELYQHGDIDAQRGALEGIERALTGGHADDTDADAPASTAVSDHDGQGRISRQDKPSSADSASNEPDSMGVDQRKPPSTRGGDGGYRWRVRWGSNPRHSA